MPFWLWLENTFILINGKEALEDEKLSLFSVFFL